MYNTNSTDTVPVLHYGIPLEGINPPVTVYIHRALRTIGQYSMEGKNKLYSYQLLRTTLVHPLASTGTIRVPSTGAIPVPSTGAIPVPSTGAIPVPMHTGTGDITEQQGQSSQYNWLGPSAPKRSKLNW